MRDLGKEFENRDINYQQLLDYGFVEENKCYSFQKNICNGNFNVIVEISKKEKKSKVIDIFTDSEYALVDVRDLQGSFVGQVREEYENIINDIIQKCSILNVFKSNQAKQIIEYVKYKYGDELEYLWDKSPDAAVYRNKKNNKWYGLLLIISEKKLGLPTDNMVDIIDLKYQKESIKEIIDNKKIFEGYHMNKKSWITIKLDGTVNIKEIYKLIDNSFKLSDGK